MMSRIQRTSYWVSAVLKVARWILPIGICYHWLTIETPYGYLSSLGIVEFDMQLSSLTQSPLSMDTRMFAIAASLAIAMILIYGLNLLIQLFKNYQRNEVFNQENSILISKLGRVIFFWVIGGFIYSGVMSVILSFNNPPGTRVLQLTFTGVDAFTLFVGVIVLIISWVMKEASDIAYEHDQTV